MLCRRLSPANVWSRGAAHHYILLPTSTSRVVNFMSTGVGQ
jgi:hypothetical protein